MTALSLPSLHLALNDASEGIREAGSASCSGLRPFPPLNCPSDEMNWASIQSSLSLSALYGSFLLLIFWIEIGCCTWFFPVSIPSSLSALSPVTWRTCKFWTIIAKMSVFCSQGVSQVSEGFEARTFGHMKLEDGRGHGKEL